MVSEREPETREVTCLSCGTINQFNIGKYMGGVKTIFCKECGEEIRMTYDITLVGLELKRGEKGPN